MHSAEADEDAGSRSTRGGGILCTVLITTLCSIGMKGLKVFSGAVGRGSIDPMRR